MQFENIKAAGLTQQEFAALVGSSRVTVNLWVNGTNMPHRYIREKLTEVLTALGAAVAEEKLPLPASACKGRARVAAIADILGIAFEPERETAERAD